MRQCKISAAQSEYLGTFGIRTEELQGVAVLHYEKGEFVCAEGQPFERLLFVLKGTAKACFTMENGKSLLLSFYRSGGIMGDIELMLDEWKAKASVQAVTTFQCIAIPFSSNRTALRSNAEFLNRIGTGLARKLEISSRNSAVNSLYPLEARLCSYVEATSKDSLFSEKLTEVSELLGSSYRNLLRSLQKLCRQGTLEKRKDGYYIVDRRALHRCGKDFYTMEPRP